MILRRFKALYKDSDAKNLFDCYAPVDQLQDFDSVSNLLDRINVRKSQGADCVPLSLSNRPQGRYMIAAHLLEIMQQKSPDPVYFQARLICLNKLKDDQIPTVLDLRPLAITGLNQKLVELILLDQIRDQTNHL